MKGYFLLSALVAAFAIFSPARAQEAEEQPGEIAGGQTTCDYTLGCDLGGGIRPISGWIDKIGKLPGEIDDYFERRKREKLIRQEAERQRKIEEAKRQLEEAEKQRRAELERKRKQNKNCQAAPNLCDTVNDFAKIENNLFEQAHRINSIKGNFGFSGQGANDDGSLSWSGRFVDGYIYGAYSLSEIDDGEVYDSGGNFAGVATRGGRVTGTYRNSTFNERGTFTGQFSPALNQIFSGGFKCTANCEDD